MAPAMADALPFTTFWNWLMSHPNCILRAGTPDCVLYDDEDLHWHFAAEGAETLLVQALRGKRLVGEILLAPEDVAYVQAGAGDTEGEHSFELIAETESDRAVAYFFVLSHAYEEQEGVSPGHVH
jgi:hypothetical protein